MSELSSPSGSAPPEAKASGLNATVRALQSMVPPSAFARVVRSLPPETAELIRSRRLPIEWIPAARYGDLIVAALREVFDGDEEKVGELGRRMIRAELSTIHRLFIKLLSAQYVIERAPKLWGAYNRANGAITVTMTGAQACTVHYQGVRAIYPGHWAYHRGVIVGVIEATGYRQVAARVIRGGRLEREMILHTSWG